VTKIGDREEKISRKKDETKRLILPHQYKWDSQSIGAAGQRGSDLFFCKFLTTTRSPVPRSAHPFGSIEA